MKYQKKHIELSAEEIQSFILNALHYADTYSHLQYLNPNNYQNAFPHEISFGAYELATSDENKLDHHLKKSELRGFFSYDYKNRIEDLESNNIELHSIPEFQFFIPKHILKFEQDSVTILSIENPDILFQEITRHKSVSKKYSNKIDITPLQSKEEYIKTIRSIKNDIKEGTVYELCHCMPFEVKNIEISAIDYYYQLNTLSPTPFSGLLKSENEYLICASPERFLRKEKNKIISQPIKGTIRRGTDTVEDQLLMNRLKSSEKERAENLMIVDLVRNDIAKSAISGTTTVEELFGIYTFPNLHQMISTITGKVKESISGLKIIQNAFPMGSMTGAPKVKAMELIEKYEVAKRGLYSGSIGYFDINGNFDFNVVIRSISYSKKEKNLSFFVGSAITYDSDPDSEYEECLLKAKAILNLLSS